MRITTGKRIFAAKLNQTNPEEMKTLAKAYLICLAVLACIANPVIILVVLAFFAFIHIVGPDTRDRGTREDMYGNKY